MKITNLKIVNNSIILKKNLMFLYNNQIKMFFCIPK